MTPQFWSLYLPVIGALFALGILTGMASTYIQRAYRRWQVRREMTRVATEQREREEDERNLTIALTLEPGQGLAFGSDEAMKRFIMRREELDGLATAQDKATRRIVR